MPSKIIERVGTKFKLSSSLPPSKNINGYTAPSEKVILQTLQPLLLKRLRKWVACVSPIVLAKHMWTGSIRQCILRNQWWMVDGKMSRCMHETCMPRMECVSPVVMAKHIWHNDFFFVDMNSDGTLMGMAV